MGASNKQKTKSQRTALDRAAEIGVSIPTLNSWKRCGVNVDDDEQVRQRIARMRNIPPTLKPEWLPKIQATIQAPNEEDPTSIDIEAIIRQLSAVTDKHQAQTVKLQIDGLLNAYKLREAAGKYVSRAKVDEGMIRIGAAVKAAIARLSGDIPPMVHGASIEDTQKMIKEKCDEVLVALSDKKSELWEETNEI